jgi:hypothetical protein
MHPPKPVQWPILPRRTLREQIYPWDLSRPSFGRNTKGCQQYLPLRPPQNRNRGDDLTVRSLLHPAEALLP